MRPYYSEFVRHCLRYYIKTLDEAHGGVPVFRSDAERENWAACHDVLKDYSATAMDMISHIYRPGDTIADKIYELSQSKRTSQNDIWSTINSLEKKIAKRRGLV